MPDDPAPEPALTPAQEATLARLGARAAERPVFPRGLRDDLRRALEGELAEAAVAIPEGTRLVVSKHALATVHACEARWHADALEDAFVPSPAVVQGAVAHKAIELSLNRRSPAAPGELVDTAIDRLADTDLWMSEWLRDCDEDDRAEVRGAAVARVSAFTDAWPPLKARWRPVTEQALRAELLGGRVVLSGRVDLALGRGEPTDDGVRAGKVIVDFKTGGPSPSHVDDLRFYALLDTLRTGIPPRAVASSYLDSADLHVEVVTEGHLHAAAARAVDGAERMIALLHGEGAVAARRPSGACRWCRLRDDCAPGRAHLADAPA